eukprot:164674-Pyramimonas_sp.AAC.1
MPQHLELAVGEDATAASPREDGAPRRVQADALGLWGERPAALRARRMATTHSSGSAAPGVAPAERRC